MTNEEDGTSMRPLDISSLEAASQEAMINNDFDLAEVLADRADELARSRGVGTLRDYALLYAIRGVPVLPLIPLSKRPLTGHGLLDATVDQAKINWWWSQTPDANIGLLTGILFDVADVDLARGALSWARMPDNKPTMKFAGRVIYGTVSTPRGTHLYIEKTGFNNTTNLYPGIDFRGEGGYVVAPPSVINEPDSKGAYKWRRMINFQIDRKSVV